MSFSPVNPTATSDSVAFGSGYNITGSGTFQSTGLSITLPEAGKYLLLVDVRATLLVSAGVPAYLLFELYNATDSAVVPNSVRFGPYCPQVNVAAITTTPIHVIVTVTAAKTIALYASRNGGTAYNNSSVDSGHTVLSYVKLA